MHWELQILVKEGNKKIFKSARTSTGKIYKYPTKEEAEKDLKFWSPCVETHRIIQVKGV